MTIDRDRLETAFALESPPTLFCPDCSRGHVGIDRNSRTLHLDLRSKGADEVLSRDEFVARGTFWCKTLCTFSDCAREGTVGGDFSQTFVHQYHDDDYEEEFSCTPRAFFPSPLLFIPPSTVPDHISQLLRSAFGLYWMDAGACTAKCRVVVEALLTHLKVPKTQTTGKKRSRLTLDARITSAKTDHPHIAELLRAAKWLGNDGAHGDELAAADVLDALELLHAVLDELFSTRRKQALSIATAINKRKRGRRRRHP